VAAVTVTAGGNPPPADMYFGRVEAILMERKQLKEHTQMARKQANLTPTKTHEISATYVQKPSNKSKPNVSHLF
jgi:hypothetical protein